MYPNFLHISIICSAIFFNYDICYSDYQSNRYEKNLDKKIEEFYEGYEVNIKSLKLLLNKVRKTRYNSISYDKDEVINDLSKFIEKNKESKNIDDKIYDYKNGILNTREDKKKLLNELFIKNRFGDLMDQLVEDLFPEGRESLPDLEMGFKAKNLSNSEENILFNILDRRVGKGGSIAKRQELIYNSLKDKYINKENKSKLNIDNRKNDFILSLLIKIQKLIPEDKNIKLNRNDVIESLEKIIRNYRNKIDGNREKKYISKVLSSVEEYIVKSKRSKFPINYVVNALLSDSYAKKDISGYAILPNFNYFDLMVKIENKESFLLKNNYEITPFNLTKDESLLMLKNYLEKNDIKCSGYSSCLNGKIQLLNNLKSKITNAVILAATNDLIVNYKKLAMEEFPYNIIFSLVDDLDENRVKKFDEILKKRQLSIEKLRKIYINNWNKELKKTTYSSELKDKMLSYYNFLIKREENKWIKKSEINSIKKDNVSSEIKDKKEEFKKNLKDKQKKIVSDVEGKLENVTGEISKNIEKKLSEGLDGFLKNIL